MKTPTLVVVGDRDRECPTPRDLGVKTEIVIYPNDADRFHTAPHQKDLLVRMTGRFNENLK